MGVIEDHLHTLHLEHVQTAGRLVDRRRERTETLADVVQVRTRGVGRGRGRHRVLHHHPRPAVEGGRQHVDIGDRRGAPPFLQHHQLAERTVLQHDGLPPPPDPAIHELVLLLHREEDHLAPGVPTHLEHQGVVGVQDGPAGLGHRLHDHLLHGGELLEGIDLTQPEMVARHVQHDPHVVPPVAESLAEDAPARDLEDGHVDPRVLQDHLCRLRPRGVDALDEALVDVDPIRRGHPDLAAQPSEDVGDHPGRGGLPVRAGHGDDRDPRRGALREQLIDHGLRDVLRLPLRRIRVHPEPRRGVHLDDRAAGLPHRKGDVRREEVDPGDVEPDDAAGFLRDLDVVFVCLPRAVDRDPTGGHVAGRDEQHPLSLRRHVVHAESLAAHELFGPRIDGDPREHLLVSDPSTRVQVRDLDQLTDRVLPVADHVRRHTLGDRHHPSPHHEHPVVVALHEGLHDDPAVPRLSERMFEPPPHGLLVEEVQPDAAPVIAVQRLRDDRIADAQGRSDGVVGAANHLAARDGKTRRREQLVRHLLVGRDVDREGRRHRRHRGADPLLVFALTELDQRGLVEAHPRDVARRGFVDDRLCGRTERPALGELDEAFQLREEIEVLLGLDEMVDQANGQLPRLDADGLLPVAVDHVVPARLPRPSRLPARDVRSGFPLELERDVLGDVAEPRPVDQPFAEPAAASERARVLGDAREQRQETFDEPRDLVGRPFLQGPKVDQHPDARLVGPVVGAPENLRLDDLQIRLGFARLGRRRLALEGVTAGASRRLGRASLLRSRLRHVDASPSSRASGPVSSARPRRSNRYPEGRECRMAPLTMTGR